MDKIKIACIVVTYNRLLLLKSCIEAIKNQSYNDFDIIIVNNGSSDGTTEWLSTQKDFIVINQNNSGGAGGFHNGIKYAYNHGYDYFWIMDDDGLPDKKCLESLLKGAKMGFHYVAPILYTIEGICHHPLILNTKCNIISHEGGPFNAILLSKDLIKDIGLPNKHYFIWGDEFEFVNRIKENYFHVALVKEAIHYHKIPENSKTLNSRIYYKVRNLIWSSRLSKGIVRGKLYSFLTTIRDILIYTIKSISTVNFKSLINILKGIKDGIKMNQQTLKNGSLLE